MLFRTMNYRRISGFYAFLIGILLTACTIHTGTISGGSGVITDDRFAVTRLVMGTAKTTQFLGIGGFEKDAMVFEAKKNMIQHAEMQPGEVIGQTTVDFKRTFFFPIQSNKVTISAEIIDFSKPSNPSEVPDLYPEAVETISQERVEESESVRTVIKSRYGNVKSTYAIGEEVYYFAGDRNQWVEAKVIEIVADKYKVEFESKKGKLKQKEVQSRSLRAKLEAGQ